MKQNKTIIYKNPDLAVGGGMLSIPTARSKYTMFTLEQ